MTKTLKATHNDFCNYEIAKANKLLRLYTVREQKRKPLGIRTSNASRAMLARQLASFFNGEYNFNKISKFRR